MAEFSRLRGGGSVSDVRRPEQSSLLARTVAGREIRYAKANSYDVHDANVLDPVSRTVRMSETAYKMSKILIDRPRHWFAMCTASMLCLTAASIVATAIAQEVHATPRQPGSEAQLRMWLENMVAYHRFSIAEVEAATGLPAQAIQSALARFEISPGVRPQREPDAPLTVLPYPGGRHPRIGFLEGAIDPQRETKVSVFAPWDEASYFVIDVPEAIWSQHGLLYLAHTHVETIWTRQGIELAPLEWERQADGHLTIRRELPNRVAFTAAVKARADGVSMELTLTNDSDETLTDLRVQNCVMLKGAAGFTEQTNENKVFTAPYAACRAHDGERWVITAWSPIHRAWGNERCPCLHADPKFPDCPPGATVHVRGWLSFYEREDIQAEFRRLDSIGWQRSPAATNER